MSLIKVIVVDDSVMFREGLKFYLEKILFYQVIAEASNGDEFLKLPDKHLADVILMDIEMPVLNGIDAVLKDPDSNLKKIIAITSFEEKIYLSKLFESGFKGYINKKNIYTDLKNAILCVVEGKFFVPESIKI
jgi:DNA-binding NarL/FixJ family response regulator